MKHCDTEGCDHPAEHRWCGECWLAFEDFVRHGGRPDLHGSVDFGEQDASATMRAWLDEADRQS